MSLSGYVIEKYSNMGDAYTCSRFVEEAEKLGIELEVIGAADLSLGANGVFIGGRPLGHRDFAMNRYKYGHVKDSVNALVYRGFNNINSFNRYIDKYYQLEDLPSWIDSPRYLLSTSSDDFSRLNCLLGAPFVAKGLRGSQGDEVFLIESRDGFDSLSERFGSRREFLFEQFISLVPGRDCRSLVVAGEVVACMLRQSSIDFRANVALGASVQPFEADDDIRAIARSLYDAFGLDYFGLDLLLVRDGYAFCEVNVMPGIRGVEEATGVNVAQLIMQMVEDRMA